MSAGHALDNDPDKIIFASMFNVRRCITNVWLKLEKCLLTQQDSDWLLVFLLSRIGNANTMKNDHLTVL